MGTAGVYLEEGFGGQNPYLFGRFLQFARVLWKKIPKDPLKIFSSLQKIWTPLKKNSEYAPEKKNIEMSKKISRNPENLSSQNAFIRIFIPVTQKYRDWSCFWTSLIKRSSVVARGRGGELGDRSP